MKKISFLFNPLFILILLNPQFSNACDIQRFASEHTLEVASCYSNEKKPDQIHLATYSIGDKYTTKAFYLCSGKGFTLEFNIIDEGQNCKSTWVHGMSTQRIK